jgi:hypothetical protein
MPHPTTALILLL